jgi:mRNA-degrading endonuclease RelE of RelBE toxin-antitoxin system
MAGKGKKAGIEKKSGHESYSVLHAVDMTATAEAAYVDLARKAKAAEASGEHASAHRTTFHIVSEAVKRIIPNDPANKKYALRGDLSNVFRLRKGRLRICWIASSKRGRVWILFIAQTLRKEGDANDPYAIFQGMLDSGDVRRGDCAAWRPRAGAIGLSGRTRFSCFQKASWFS